MSFGDLARARGLPLLGAFADDAPLTWDGLARDPTLELGDPHDAAWALRLMARQGPSPPLLAALFGVNQKTGAALPPFDEPLDGALAAADALGGALFTDEELPLRARLVATRAAAGLPAAVDPAWVRGACTWRRVLDVELDRALAHPAGAPLAVVAAVAARAHASTRFAAFCDDVMADAEALATARLPTLALALLDALGDAASDEALLLRTELALDHSAPAWLPDRACADPARERARQALVAMRTAIARGALDDADAAECALAAEARPLLDEPRLVAASCELAALRGRFHALGPLHTALNERLGWRYGHLARTSIDLRRDDDLAPAALDGFIVHVGGDDDALWARALAWLPAGPLRDAALRTLSREARHLPSHPSVWRAVALLAPDPAPLLDEIDAALRRT